MTHKLIKIRAGFYDIGNTGLSVRKANSGTTMGKWYVEDADGRIWVDSPQDCRADAVGLATGNV